jgi:PHD/YefM family antitoxin component YafN of YafNO toxin-antitoxin module
VLDELEHDQQPIVIMRGGREMAAVVPIDEFRRDRRRGLSAEWWRKQDEIAREIEENLNGRPFPDVDDLINYGQR